jgi:hypothetical protein
MNLRPSNVEQLNVVLPGRVLDSEGRFEVKGVPEGTHVLSVITRGPNPTVTLQTVHVQSEDIDNLIVACANPVRIPGRILQDGNLRMRFPAGDMRNRVTVDVRSSLSMTGYGSLVQQNGTFALFNIPAGDYELSVRGLDENLYIQSAMHGTRNILDEGLAVTSGQAETIEIVLSDKAGKIEGMVIDGNGKPAGNVQVVLVPDEPFRRRAVMYLTALTDETGSFTISRVAPGGYQLFAWEFVEGEEYRRAEFLSRYPGKGHPVTVGPSARINATLTLLQR